MFRQFQRSVFGVALSLCAGTVAEADEMLTVAGERIRGLVLDEGARGVWMEVAPRVAMYIAYDRVVRVDKWSSERNAALINRKVRAAPLPPNILDGHPVLRTPEGTWIQVKPRLARFVKKDVLRTLLVKQGKIPEQFGRTVPHAGYARDRDASLWKLYDSPETLTPAQLGRRVGQPDRKRRTAQGREWTYTLADGTKMLFAFRKGQLDFVDVIDPSATPDQTAGGSRR